MPRQFRSEPIGLPVGRGPTCQVDLTRGDAIDALYVVERVIGPLGPEPKASPERPTLLDPYVDFIDEVLGRYPRLVSTRIYDMVVERGYPGSMRTLTRHVSKVRPAPKSKVFLRTEAAAGEAEPGGLGPCW